MISSVSNVQEEMEHLAAEKDENMKNMIGVGMPQIGENVSLAKSDTNPDGDVEANPTAKE